MWPYADHSELEYDKAIEFIEQYAQSLGAKYICSKLQKFTTISDNQDTIQEALEMKIYKYGDGYFWLERHFQPDCPFIVFSFGDSVDTIFEDAEPFPYNLTEEELKAEVRYSLGLEKYPAVKEG